jgi:hypothetical protein
MHAVCGWQCSSTGTRSCSGSRRRPHRSSSACFQISCSRQHASQVSISSKFHHGLARIRPLGQMHWPTSAGCMQAGMQACVCRQCASACCGESWAPGGAWALVRLSLQGRPPVRRLWLDAATQGQATCNATVAVYASGVQGQGRSRVRDSGLRCTYRRCNLLAPREVLVAVLLVGQPPGVLGSVGGRRPGHLVDPPWLRRAASQQGQLGVAIQASQLHNEPLQGRALAAK